VERVSGTGHLKAENITCMCLSCPTSCAMTCVANTFVLGLNETVRACRPGVTLPLDGSAVDEYAAVV